MLPLAAIKWHPAITTTKSIVDLLHCHHSCAVYFSSSYQFVLLY